MISVVIPCYNAAATLADTIASALSQDAEHEVIVVDDGSTDRSPDVLDQYARRVQVIRTPNCGASAARTLGTSRASGQYIQYLDSDDILTPGTLKSRREALEASEADVAHTDWRKFSVNDDGLVVPGAIMRPDIEALARNAEIATATSTFWAPPAALLYRRQIIDRVGAWHPAMPVVQDARYLFEAAARGARFTYVPGIGAEYRVSPDSLSRRNAEQFINDCALNAEEIEHIWLHRGDLSLEQRAALASMWSHVATASLFGAFDGFENARRNHNRHAAYNLKFEVASALRFLIGKDQAAHIARTVPRIKSALRISRSP